MISFKGYAYPKEVILQAVPWYLAYTLSYRDIEELLAERGIHVDHATINRWVIAFAPKLEQAYQKRKRRPGNRVRMDYNKEYGTRIKIRQNKYLNNIVESDHRFVKRKMRQTMGFETLRTASNTIAGLELWRMLKKGQTKWGGTKSPVELFYGLAI